MVDRRFHRMKADYIRECESLGLQAVDILSDAGFLPVDAVHDRHATSDLDWIERYGWQAFLDGGDEVVLARWNEDGVLLTQSARNYIIMGEARFDLTPFGINLLTAALGVSSESASQTAETGGAGHEE